MLGLVSHGQAVGGDLPGQAAALLARRAGEVLADARVVTVPDASHFMLPQECPEVINPELAKFLAMV